MSQIYLTDAVAFYLCIIVQILKVNTEDVLFHVYCDEVTRSAG